MAEEAEKSETFTRKAGYIAFGALIGALASYASSYGLWYVQAKYSYKEAVKKSREELIVEAADILAHAPRIKGIVKAGMMQAMAGNAITNICLAAVMRGEEIESCKKGVDYSFIEKFEKDIFIYTAKYQKLKNLASIYFCNKTNEKFQQFDSKIAWWEISQNETKALLKAMHSEYTCKL